MSEAQANTLEWFSYKVRPMLREIRAKLATYLSVRSFPRTDHGQHSLKFPNIKFRCRLQPLFLLKMLRKASTL
jgi:hypothetical protein